MAENSWLGTAQDALQGAVSGAAMGSVVPGVGTAIGGLAGLASGLVPHLAPAVAADIAPALATAAAAITGKSTEPEQVADLSADNDAMSAFRVQVMSIAAQRAAAADVAANATLTARLADTANARAATQALAGANSKLAWGTPAVSLTVLAMFGAVLATVVLHGFPAGTETVLNVLLGTLAAMATNVVGYWVGSSAGSAAKTEAAAQRGVIL